VALDLAYFQIRVNCIQTASRFLLKQYKFNLFTRYWIQAYLDLAIACFIQFTVLPQVKIEVVSSFMLGCVFFGLLLTTPVGLVIFCNSKKEQIKSESSEFYKSWGALFNEFKCDLAPSLTYSVFTLKRLLFAGS